MPELSQSTKNLIQKYQTWHRSLQKKENIATIHVDEVASAVAVFYEKIRELLDWREEHLMKKTAIERVLKRRLIVSGDGLNIAEPFVLELIRGGHFLNDKIPEEKIGEVQKVIEKYVFILEYSSSANEKIRIDLYDWILGVAACEIEETLAPLSFSREKALIEYMTESMTEKIKLKGLVAEKITDTEKNTQIYIAVQKALFKLDESMLVYNLLKRTYPSWKDLTATNPLLIEISKNIYSIWDGIEKELKHPFAEKFYIICEKYDTLYLILGDIISENPETAAEDIKAPEVLKNRTTAIYQKKLTTLKSRMQRAAVYATLSIFLTKILLVLAVEIPLDRYLGQQSFSYFNLGLNIIIPPLLMFFLVLSITLPSKSNLLRSIMEMMKVAYTTEIKDTYTLELYRKKGMHFLISIFYFFTFFVPFAIIILGLNKLHFSIFSIIIFLSFISLVSFAGIKIRERAKELEIAEQKEAPLMLFIDFFSLPFIQVGKWLSSQWKRYNVALIIVNFLIDMPFQTFVEFLEQWRSFLKEKKEKIH